MSNCCSTSTPVGPGAESCPVSGTRGKQVDLVTVKALLTEAALARLQHASHYFCPDAICDIVYFDAGGRTYSTSEVRVPVWQKAQPGDRMVCYCFGETETVIREEIMEIGRSASEQRIRAHIAAGRCACEIRNPRGVCCLGDVIAATEHLADVTRERAVTSCL